MAQQWKVTAQQMRQLRAAKAAATKRYLRPARGTAVRARTTRGSALARANADPRINVVGVGIGRKVVGGKLTKKPCVRLYVQHKLHKSAIEARAMLPRTIGGVATDVIQTGAFRALQNADVIARARSRLRPVQPGCSVGYRFPPPNQQARMAGTLGAVVRRDGLSYLLSNNHVLADEGRLRAGAPIYQPGLLDGGRVTADAVAKLTRFVPFRTTNNRVDAAIAQVDRAGLASPRFVATVVLRSSAPLPATIDLAVHKVGRTTGYTRGVVDDVSADVRVGYYGGEYLFVDQIVVRSSGAGEFSDSGDSGSLIVARTSGRATGLLFAGSPGFTLANPIGLVLQAFGVTLVV
jgi:hypothetical protein